MPVQPVPVEPIPAQITEASDPAPELLAFVDFKWLMAGEGHRIDLDRLQIEPDYAHACLALAAGSTSVTLRQAAQRLVSIAGVSASNRRAGP